MSAKRHQGCLTTTSGKPTPTASTSSRSSSRSRTTGAAGMSTGGGGSSSGSRDAPSSVSTIATSKKASKNSTILYSQSQRHRSRVCEHECPCDCAEVDKNKLHFILPANQTKDDVSSLMREMYQDSDLRKFTVLWMEEREVISLLEPEASSIFVLDRFEGRAYKHLETKLYQNQNFMIIGPQVLRFMFERCVPEYMKSLTVPLFSLAMNDIIITTSGVKEEKRELISLVEKMGGMYDTKYTLHITHVVASSVLGDKVKTAKKKRLPVMKPEWIYEVWRRSQSETVHATDAEFAEFETPMFLNLCFCFSQISVHQRERLQRSVEANGGTHSPALVRKTINVLILPHAEGDKFRHANMWNILCLLPAWIVDSCEAGYALDPSNYKVKSKASGQFLSSTLIAGGAGATGPPQMDVTSCSIINSNTPNSSVVANSIMFSSMGDSVVVRAGNMPDPETFRNMTSATVPDRAIKETTTVPAIVVNKANENNRRTTGSGSSGSGASGTHQPSIDDNCGAVESDVDPQTSATTPEPIAGVFEGKKFRMELSCDSEAEQRVHDMIKGVGGELTTINFDYIITTPTFSDRSFFDHPHYTEHWLVDCEEANSTMVPPAFYHVPVFAHQDVKGVLTGVVIAVSNYGMGERSYVSDLAEFMGAKVQEVFAKKAKGKLLATTHLICNTLTNLKAEAAIRWKLPVVTCEWILKCYASKERLETHLFTPGAEMEGEEPKEEAEDAPVVAAHSSKGSSLSEKQSRGDSTGSTNGENLPPPTTKQSLNSRDTTETENKNMSRRKSSLENPHPLRSFRDETGNDGTVPQASAMQTPINPRVMAVGVRKLSLGLDSPFATQEERKTDSPPYRYVFPSMAQMLLDAEAASPVPSKFKPMPSPETPKLHEEWLEHLRETWIRPAKLRELAEAEAEAANKVIDKGLERNVEVSKTEMSMKDEKSKSHTRTSATTNPSKRTKRGN